MDGFGSAAGAAAVGITYAAIPKLVKADGTPPTSGRAGAGILEGGELIRRSAGLLEAEIGKMLGRGAATGRRYSTGVSSLGLNIRRRLMVRRDPPSPDPPEPLESSDFAVLVLWLSESITIVTS